MPSIARVANYSDRRYRGWKRTTTDAANTRTGVVDGVQVVVGRRIGTDARIIDLLVDLAPWEQRSIDLERVQPNPWRLGGLPPNPIEFFGGLPTLAGQPMGFAGIVEDGAAWTAHWVTRIGPMLCAHVWTTWYPDTPRVMHGEVVVVASNPAVPDMAATVPPGFHLRWGGALLSVPGREFGSPLIDAGTVLADGQGRAMPFWLWRQSGSMDQLPGVHIAAVGLQSLLTHGNPLFPRDFSARAWANERFAEAVRRPHTWDPPIVGPSIRSADAGEQEDQLLHPGGEAMLADGVGAEWVRYLSAIKLHAERPCNHLEPSGLPLDLAQHPRLLLWDGRPHPNTNVSPDRLGKPRELTIEETHGRWGPDTQHFLTGSLTAAARLTGSHACQWLLERLVTVYLLQRTSESGWATSGTFSAREWGYEGLFVAQCLSALADQPLRNRVVEHWHRRVDRILVPLMRDRDLLHQLDRDPRVHPTGIGVQWWQESFAAYGIDLACELTDRPDGRAIALRIARCVLDVAWHQDGATWRAQPQGPIDGSANAENPRTHDFDRFGMPLCVATVLRHEPTNAKARAIWAQLLADRGELARRWMPPGIA